MSPLILENKKLDDGSIWEAHKCDLQYGCGGKPSLTLIEVKVWMGTGSEDIVMCKTCLNYLIKQIDQSILGGK